MEKAQRVAEIGYSEKYGKLELVVPHGTTSADIAKLSSKLFGEFAGRLPRGCQACLSGESFTIRERLEHVVMVDLERMEILGR